MFGPLLLDVLIFCKLNYVFANGHLEIHRVLNCDARWSLPGRESVVWWWQATRALFFEWQVELKNYGLGAFLDWMCHFHVHVMIINHCVHTVNRLENTVRNHKFCFGQFRFFCMWNILNSEMDKFATCGHGRSMLPRMNFTTNYLEGITVIPNWHLLLLFYSVDYCANLWQLLFD